MYYLIKNLIADTNIYLQLQTKFICSCKYLFAEGKNCQNQILLSNVGKGYQETNKYFRNTATNDLTNLVEKGILKPSGKKGKGSYYVIAH
jgi:hypothetical protein